MGFFDKSNPIEPEIEKATSEKNTVDKWGLIMDICDKIGTSSVAAKESLKMIVRRLNHPDPHVVMQAITLLDACVNNCGKNYHLEIASRDFEIEFKKLLGKAQPQVSNKLKQCLKKWAEGDFKSDPQLNLIPSLYHKLKSEGNDFSDSQTTPKREIVLSKDPNVVNSQQEEDDIAKAIELSLKEKSGSPKASTTNFYSSSIYPNMNMPTTISGTPATNSASAPAPEPRKVRALYDFEAAEDNELTFKGGEIIMVLEDTDVNWWRGQNHRGEGFFPSNFVSADLSAEPENLTKDKTSVSSKKTVLFAEDQQKQEQQQPIEVNEDSIDRLLFLLHEADPSDPSQDSEEMLRLEHVVNQMAPLIDSELERVDRKHAQLTQLSSDLIDTINLYHSLMRDSEMAPGPGYMQGGFQGQQGMYGGPQPMPGAVMYQNNHYRMAGGNMPPNMIPPGMMGPQGRMEFPPSSLGYQMPQQPSQQQQHMTNGHNQHPHSQGASQQIHQQQPIVNPNNSQMNMMPQQQQQQIGNMPPMQGMPVQGTQSQMQMHLPPGQNFPPNHQQQQQQQQQQQPALPQQHIGLPPQQQNFPMNPSMTVPNMHPQHQQMQQMMGNMNLQSPPASMQNLHQMPGPMPNQINQPMTYLHQTDSNQNIPIYQQQR